MPVLLFCIAFGLSMDYEVFLLSRIREYWLASGGRLSNRAKLIVFEGPQGDPLTGGAASPVLGSTDWG
jgi:uncharacterized membrane protein YdfJ with MMPL/SSD domain